MRTVPIDVMNVGIDMQVQLEHTRHVVEVHVVILFLFRHQPRSHSHIDVLQQHQVWVSQVADRSQVLILKDNKVSKIMTVVFVHAQAPLRAVDEDLLVLT